MSSVNATPGPGVAGQDHHSGGPRGGLAGGSHAQGVGEGDGGRGRGAESVPAPRPHRMEEGPRLWPVSWYDDVPAGGDGRDPRSGPARRPVFVPSPSSPSPLLPQQRTPPPARMAQVWVAPAAMAVNAGVPGVAATCAAASGTTHANNAKTNTTARRTAPALIRPTPAGSPACYASGRAAGKPPPREPDLIRQRGAPVLIGPRDQLAVRSVGGTLGA